MPGEREEFPIVEDHDHLYHHDHHDHHDHNHLNEVGGYPESGVPSDLDNWRCRNNSLELGKASLAQRERFPNNSK